jgi:DNA-binding GntR family transcriptional regulator
LKLDGGNPPTSDKVEHVEYFTKSDVVTSAIRELVITGELPAGTELRQRDLAARFNVSPTPVREALRRLESEGLVHYDVHRGARVIETDFEADEENFLIRAALERLAVELAADRVTEEDLEAMEALNARLAESELSDLGEPTVAELNRQLHFQVYEAARSPLLLALLRLLWHSFPPSRHTTRSVEHSVRQHAEIIDALRARDSARAQAAITTHILEFRPRAGGEAAAPLA